MTRETVYIIIVEDDKDLQNMYQTSVDEFNIENEGYEINCSILPNDDEIPKLLYNQHIDAIIIDLDWGTGFQQNEGNRLVKKIYEDCRVPIFIVSGNLHLLEENYDESPIFRKYQRDEVDNYELMKEIMDLYKTGYTKALGNLSKIDEMLTEVFQKHMLGVVTEWGNLAKDIQEQRMLRFAVTRINEMLTVNGEDTRDDYDALEFYISPAIKEKPFTGDIVSYDEKKFVVITAACDMEQDKSDYVVLCQIDFNTIDNLKRDIKGEEKEAKKAKEKFGRYVNNAIARYHLLPPCQLFSGGLLDFQLINSVSKEDFHEKASVIASINPVFHKDIQARFSHYYGRQGQPQLNKDNIIAWIKAN